MPWSQNWLLRGAQSALFYYVSCTPCINAKRTYEQKKQNKREKARMHGYDTAAPDAMVYRQPQPRETNIHWYEDIMTGPIPTKYVKKTQRDYQAALKRTQKEQRREQRPDTPTTLSEREDVPQIRVNEAEGQVESAARAGAENSTANTSAASIASFPLSAPEMAASRPDSAVLNDAGIPYNHFRWYMRPDEELFGVSKGHNRATYAETTQDLESLPVPITRDFANMNPSPLAATAHEPGPIALAQPTGRASHSPSPAPTTRTSSHNSSAYSEHTTHTLHSTPLTQPPSTAASNPHRPHGDANTPNYQRYIEAPFYNNGHTPVCLPPQYRRTGVAWMFQELPPPEWMSGKSIENPSVVMGGAWEGQAQGK